MRIDEEKALRLRKLQLEAELDRINQLLHHAAVEDFEITRGRDDDFRNADSNGNYNG